MTIRENADLLPAVVERLSVIRDSVVVKIHGGACQESGLPDLFFTCHALGGRAVFMELKAPDGKLSKIQQYKLAKMRRAGAISVCVKSVEELESFLEDWGCS